MNFELGASVLVGVAPVLVALVALLGRPDRLRARLKHDAEIAGIVPEGTSARAAVLELVEHDARLVLNTRNLSRELGGVGLGIGGSVLFGFFAIWLFQHDNLFARALAVFFGILWVVFFFGIFDSAQLRDREAKKAEQDEKKLAKKLAKAAKRQAHMAQRSAG